MIETKEQRDSREHEEGMIRHARSVEYAKKMEGTAVQDVLRNTSDASGTVAQQGRAEYFREYRKRERYCPHCGRKVEKLVMRSIAAVAASPRKRTD